MKIAIASGKGGTGKTTVATNLAWAAARSGRRVAYVDCDVEEPNGHLFLKRTRTELLRTRLEFWDYQCRTRSSYRSGRAEVHFLILDRKRATAA